MKSSKSQQSTSALRDFAEKISVSMQFILEKGHTQMEGDSMHSALEGYFLPPINASFEYVSQIRITRREFDQI